MTHVNNVSEIFQAISDTKKSRDAWITNFYVEDYKLLRWIDERIFFIEEFASTVFFLRKDQNFYHLYFCSESKGYLEMALLKLSDGMHDEILVADCIGSKRDLELFDDAFISANYHKYTSFDRMKKVVSENEPPYIAQNIHYPFSNEAGIIFTMFENAFDRFAEQLPSETELVRAIENKQVLIVRDNNDIAGILIRKIVGKTSTLQYFLVDERYRGRKIGSILLGYLINESRGGVINLWVLSGNKNAIEVYKHFGFTTEAVSDLLFINKTICYSDMRQKILNILVGIRPEFNFEEITDFNEDGALDSFDIVLLTVELEKQFNVTIDGMDVRKESFKNIESIVDLLHKSGAKSK